MKGKVILMRKLLSALLLVCLKRAETGRIFSYSFFALFPVFPEQGECFAAAGMGIEIQHQIIQGKIIFLNRSEQLCAAVHEQSPPAGANGKSRTGNMVPCCMPVCAS